MYNINANNSSDATLNIGGICEILTSWWCSLIHKCFNLVEKTQWTQKQKTHHAGNSTAVPKSSVIYCKLIFLEKLNDPITYYVWND